jgi:aspartyl-tRNA(Asn)/glutamyl-tRNA(Gln) amidotransferase subunit A
MADFSDLYFASIGEISARLRNKEFSTVELTRAFCDRLERFGPRYNALALSLREPAIRQARDVDDEIKRGRLRGPLQGIPYGVKDLLAVKGHPTTWGAPPYAAQVFSDDAFVVEKLNKTGGILIGKLSMVELAGGGGYRYASASLTGSGLNPWDRSRWSGGSSSGSAAATAAGLVGFALGSETSGSIVTPAAFCGVTGLRPTYGLVSRRGAMALSWTLDKIGPLARSAEDCGLVLSTIAGNDSQDPGSAGKGFTYAPQYHRKPEDIRVGYAPVDFTEWADPATRGEFRAALDIVRQMKFPLKEVEIPDYPYGSLVSTVLGGEAGSIFEEFIRSGRVDGLIDQHQIAGLKSYLDIPATEYLRAMRVRALVQDAFRTLFLNVDVLLAPARLETAPLVTERLDAGGGGALPRSRGLSGIIPAGNLAGLPAISLPCGMVQGLPIGLSFIGRPFSENQLVGIGQAFQKETSFHRNKPAVA